MLVYQRVTARALKRGLAEAWDARLSAARTKVHGPEALEARSHGLIWGLPKMGVPLNHPVIRP
jgi:nicotinamide mononucleotide (NMN) deamidase PncC